MKPLSLIRAIAIVLAFSATFAHADPVLLNARPAQPVSGQDFTFQFDDVPGAISSGEVTLAGTLTVPHGDGPFPAALLITGSGPQNRDDLPPLRRLDLL